MSMRDKTIDALATALNFRQMRQELISSNIANSETPGYRSKRLDFEDALARALNVDGANSLKTMTQDTLMWEAAPFQISNQKFMRIQMVLLLKMETLWIEIKRWR